MTAFFPFQKTINFAPMKRSFWYGLGALLLAGPAQAQSLAGVWQGVETETGEAGYWPAVLRVQGGKGTDLFGVLYQEMGTRPALTVTFQMRGVRTAGGLRLDHVRKLDETGRTSLGSWCEGAIAFAYDASQEKLTGHAAYRPEGTCDAGTFTLYRVRLKSAPAVPAKALSTLRVSGKNVLWFADAELKQPLGAGNTYRTRLSRTTTFYLTQSYYSTQQSAATPITIRVSGAASAKPAPRRTALSPPPPAPTPADTARPAPVTILPATPAPVVLPAVLFRVGTPTLLPESSPALNQLAAELKARPELKLRIAGHADRVGEPDKNQALSEQRAETVKAFLVKAGVAPERLSPVGYGDARPLFPSPDVRNRRVEVEEVK